MVGHFGLSQVEFYIVGFKIPCSTKILLRSLLEPRAQVVVGCGFLVLAVTFLLYGIGGQLVLLA